MKVLILSMSLVFFVLSCKQVDKSLEIEKEEVVYDMYQPSEMANLMNEMYAQNLEVKQDILAGKIPTEFPLDFLKIHTAEMSEFKSRNETFQSFSKLFIESEKEIFNTESQIPVEERFNNMVNLCISCHQTECTGPISRIQKLIIK
ncbi:hypothetical protein OS188_03900 [Xanthomarina sp. F1114]|uniref:hypothetical protein n=1 Tax=Xanthomarina sp. F1114 TaxID=2996019 RepID=UPI00225E35A8|nr:hypothetical protein [Xanthomarina sp. F1114]MCX7547091.1 hypothetical protein [Xanthomarina sp. F1114]